MPSDYKAITKRNVEQLGKDTASRKSQVSMYSDFSHFVYEILQNADDYEAKTVEFKLKEDELVIEHDGIPFKDENVKAISYFGRSTSRDDLIKTGQFGVGFKSVFAFTASPAIHSGEENFEIYGLYRLKALPKPNNLDQSKTRIRLPFDHEEKQPNFVEHLVSKKEAFEKISRKLKKLDITTLLFTHNVLEIKWTVLDETGHYLREDKFNQEINDHLQTRRSEITDGDELHTYLVFCRPVKWKGKDYKPVEIAFSLDVDNDGEKIEAIKEPPLFVLFPTTKETHVGFLMNGPFRTPPHRETVSEDDEFNQFLVKEMSKLLCRSLPEIKKKSLISVDFLETLPIGMDCFSENSLFYPIAEAVREALKENELLPADDGVFVSGENAMLGRGAELRELLSSDQLKELFPSDKNDKEIKWLSGEITPDQTPDLRLYLRKQLGVTELTPEIFAGKIDESFLKNQTDDWMIDFYGFLIVNQYGQLRLRQEIGLLKGKPIIRIENGTTEIHVTPFDKDGLPNAYLPPEGDTEFPVVKRGIAKDEKALEFLKMLGLKIPNIVDEVIKNILPEYPEVPNDKHQKHMVTILDAYSRVPHKDKQRLIDKLKEAAFIQAENAALKGKVAYKKPGELYFQNDDLRTYFEGNEDAWFVSSEYDLYPNDQSKYTLNMLKNLGVADEVRIECKSENGLKEFVKLGRCYSQGAYKCGLKGFDPDIRVDGFEYAIRNPSVEKSKIIWNKIAAKYCHCIRGDIRISSHQNFSPDASIYRDKVPTISEKFGKLLIETAWLPDKQGGFHKPGELSLDDLPESFQRDEKLAKQLGMKLDNATVVLAQKAGVKPEDIEFLKRNYREFEQWMRTQSGQKSKPEFPKEPAADFERRTAKVAEQINDAPKKNYEKRERSVRTTRGAVEPSTWLKNKYTNDKGQMVCQICEYEMPFKKRDGEYYFEAVEAFDRDILPKEIETPYLALCPLCAAKYKVFVKNDEAAMEELKNRILGSDDFENIPIQLDKPASLRFVETHFLDLKTILETKTKS